jgi:hypothetical protein
VVSELKRFRIKNLNMASFGELQAAGFVGIVWLMKGAR